MGEGRKRNHRGGSTTWERAERGLTGAGAQHGRGQKEKGKERKGRNMGKE